MTKNNVPDKQLTKVIYAIRGALIILFITGLSIFILLGVKNYFGSILPEAYDTTTGQIIRTETIPYTPSLRGSRSRIAEFAIIGFQVNGSQYEFKGSISRDPNDYSYDKAINVGYNPQDPNKSPMNIDELDSLRNIAILMGAIGITTMALSAFLLFALRNALKQSH